MNRSQILKKLKTLIGNYWVTVIDLSMAIPGSISFCISVRNLCYEYSSSQEDEDEVEYLLGLLARIHFKKVNRRKVAE